MTTPTTSPRRHPERLLLAIVALLFLAAPTPGDIGCSSEPATLLDPTKFFSAKQATDCERCTECGITTHTCKLACGNYEGGSFPSMCYPVVHDGEVCLDALLVASCSDYRSYVADPCQPACQSNADCGTFGFCSIADGGDTLPGVCVGCQGPTTPTECDFCPPLDGGN